MSLETTQVPAAPEAAHAVTESRSSQVPPSARPGAGSENLTGAALRAEFSRNRAPRRGSRPAAQTSGQQATADKVTPAPGSSETPPEETEEGRQANLASATAEDNPTLESLAQPAGAAATADTETQTDPAEPDLLDDPEAIESLTEDQIKGIKDSAIRKLVRRVQRLTKRYHDAEAKLQKAGATTEDPPAPRRSDAVASAEAYDQHPSVQPISSQILEIEEGLAWAEANPDGGDFVDSGGKLRGRFTAEQVANILRNAPRQLARLEARRSVKVEEITRQETEQRTAATAAARSAYPWLNQPDSDEYRLAAEVARNAPYIQQHPEWVLWVSDAVAGRRAREAKAQGTPAPKPRPSPPRIPAPNGSAAPQTDKSAKELAAAEAKFAETGSHRDLSRVMALKRAMARR